MKKTNRILSVLLAFGMLLCAASLALAEAPTFSDVDTAAEYIREQLVNRNTAPTFLYQADLSDIGDLTEEAVKSYFVGQWTAIAEELFRHTGAGNEGDYLKQHAANYGFSYSAEWIPQKNTVVFDVTVTANCYTDAAQETQVSSAVAAALEGLDLAGKSDYEKVRAITGFICDTVTYDDANLNNDAYTLKYSAFAALINGTAVCQGYASLFYRMALEAGLDARVITGTADNGETVERHAWNIVRVDGKYYYHDVTWIDGTDADDYFLRGQGGFADHFPDPEYGTDAFRSRYPIAEDDYAVSLARTCSHEWDEGAVTKAATCKEAGEMTYTCRICRSNRTETIPKTEEHVWNGGVVTEAATCTEDGVRTYTCTVCKTTRTEAVKATGHKPAKDNAVPASCTVDGKTEGSHCSVCGEVLKAQTVVKAAGHKAAVDAAVPATCTADGLTEGSHCSVCGEVLKAQTVVKAAGHKAAIDAAVPATCTADGKTEGSRCSVCGEVLKAQTVVKASGHRWDEGKVTTEPTQTQEGVKTFTCTVCGENRMEPVDRLPAAPEEPTRSPGDVDGDGKVTSADARLALRASVGLEPEIVSGTDAYRAADADGDSNVTSADARLILRASVGLEDVKKWKTA